jgi:hypothetical protein
MSKQSLYIITDSITNNVFESQVIKPVLQKLQCDNDLVITLISFENKELTLEEKNQYKTIHPRLTILLFYRPKFLTSKLLFVSSIIFNDIASKLDSYNIIARGTLAAFIAYKGATSSCTNITIQARGLLAEEYWYIKATTRFKKILYFARYCQYKRLEKKVYKNLLLSSTISTTIEAVSQALKDFLITRFGTPSELITITTSDIPEIVSQAERELWKKNMRSALHIPHEAFVYCYSGSAISWQCPEAILDFFIEKLHSTPDSILLIISQDAEIFQKLIEQKKIPSPSYRITSTNPQNLVTYLAAADAGLLFRKKHIINWVSRPTKALEYRAARLPIIHNKTVAWLNENYT